MEIVEKKVGELKAYEMKIIRERTTTPWKL